MENLDIDPGGCILELYDYSSNNPEPWSFERHPSFASARERIAEVWHTHRAKYPGHGMMVDLRNRWGGHLRLGINEQGWLILIEQASSFLRSGFLFVLSGRADDGERVLFPLGNFESEQDFPKSKVHSEENAAKAIADWVRRGDLCLQIPNPYPGPD